MLLALGIIALAACTPPPPPPQLSADGKPAPRVYRIPQTDTAKIQYNMLDSVNALRRASGAQALQLDPALNAAAATHSRDMAAQNRPWHFGSDGSSPIDRVKRAGYTGRMLGENISETYETANETLAAWMELADTRNVILDQRGRNLGFAWFQEENGKVWWTMLVGD